MMSLFFCPFSSQMKNCTVQGKRLKQDWNNSKMRRYWNQFLKTKRRVLRCVASRYGMLYVLLCYVIETIFNSR